MWSVRARGYPSNLELEPVTLLKMMNATVKRQQEVKPMIRRAMSISCADMITPSLNRALDVMEAAGVEPVRTSAAMVR